MQPYLCRDNSSKTPSPVEDFCDPEKVVPSVPTLTAQTLEASTNEDPQSNKRKAPIDYKPSTFPKRMNTGDTAANSDIDVNAVLMEILKRKQLQDDGASNDPDRLFLLSLLEDFKSIPSPKKAGVKIRMINLIREATIGARTPSKSNGLEEKPDLVDPLVAPEAIIFKEEIDVDDSSLSDENEGESVASDATSHSSIMSLYY